MKVTKADYLRVKNAAKKEPFVHKVLCRTCGWCNDPIKTHKRKNEKYYRCIKCGAELKTEKEEFRDNMLKMMKGGK